MLVWGLLLLSGIALVLLGSLALWRRPRPTGTPPWPAGPLGRLAAAGQGIIGPLGRPGAALAILLAGTSATIAICWPVGRIFRRTERAVDVPLFRFAERQHVGWWDSLNQLLTLMGNRPQIKVVCVVAAVTLAVLWRRRGAWIPPVVIGVAFFTEKFGQQVLARAADRGHPPTTLGTYPSGGCARLIAIYGTIAFLVLLSVPRARRSSRFAVWTALAAAAFVEGYTRIYLLKHWFTDVVGGWLYGSLLLGVLVAATAVLAPAGRPGRTGERFPGQGPATADGRLADGRSRALVTEGGQR